jgi:hypothetical protein
MLCRNSEAISGRQDGRLGRAGLTRCKAQAKLIVGRAIARDSVNERESAARPVNRTLAVVAASRANE